MSSATPFIFYENTGFVQQFTSNGGGGTWLSLNYREIELLKERRDEKRPVKYYSHNVDTPTDREGLLALFELWVSYSDVLKKLK